MTSLVLRHVEWEYYGNELMCLGILGKLQYPQRKRGNLVYHIYPKYYDTLFHYHTCPKIQIFPR